MPGLGSAVNNAGPEDVLPGLDQFAVEDRPPVWITFWAFRVMVARGLAVGGYENDPRLGRPTTTLSFAYLLANVATRYHYRPAAAQAIVDAANGVAPLDSQLSPQAAAALMREAACLLTACPSDGWTGLYEAGLAWRATPPDGPLDQGQAYELAARLALAGAR